MGCLLGSQTEAERVVIIARLRVSGEAIFFNLRSLIIQPTSPRSRIRRSRRLPYGTV